MYDLGVTNDRICRVLMTPLSNESGALLDVAQKSVAWWETNRPEKWSIKQHLENPAVNCTGSDAEKRLALSVAELVKLEWKEDKG